MFKNFNPLPVGISTPINTDLLADLTRRHPNKEAIQFLLTGFTRGFSIGFTGFAGPGRERNNKSALELEEKVNAAVDGELANKHLSGPFLRKPFVNMHCSPVSAVQKPDGSARLILDLSSPRGDAINDGIDKDT